MNDYLIQQSHKNSRRPTYCWNMKMERKKRAHIHTQIERYCEGEEKKKMTQIRFGADKQEIIM